MTKHLVGIGLAVLAAATCLGQGAQAQSIAQRDQFYADPYDDASQHAPRFADFEFGMSTDPLLWSTDPGWKPHHTPARLLADASAQLHAAIPAGTSVETATAWLRQAGARCGAVSGDTVECRYRDVETPWEGSYVDNVTWRVHLAVTSGRVSDLAVSRDWIRR
jgi:hypothetical protein